MKNNNKIIPIVTYNMDINKSIIYKENKGKSGIYRLNNIITGKSYIGSSVNITYRLRTYYSKKAMFAKVKTTISIIYNALLKHGYTNFTLDIIEYCEVDMLIEREQYYFDVLKPEYNILKTANSRIGSKHSLKTRALISLKLKSENHPFFGKTLSQKMRMKISEGNRAFWLKLNKDKIKRVIKPKRPYTLSKMSLRNNGLTVKVFDIKGNLVKIFPTIASAAKSFGLSTTTIRRIEKKGTYNNFLFKFEPKDFRVWVYNPNKQLVKIFTNNKETSELCNIPCGSLLYFIKSGKLWKNKFYFYNIFNLANSQVIDKQLEEITKIKNKAKWNKDFYTSNDNNNDHTDK